MTRALLLDATKNGKPLVTGGRYSATYRFVLSMIADDDRYQEVEDGEVTCDLSGAQLKEAEGRM
jgi:hypothetical protein